MGCSRGTYGEKRNSYRVLVLKPEVKRPLGIPKHRWDNIIKMDLKQVGLMSMDRTVLTEGRHRWLIVVNVVMNLWLI